MAIMLVDVSYPKWRILFCNTQVDKATGLSGSEISGQHVWDHFNVVGKAEVGLKSRCRGSVDLCICLASCLSVCVCILLSLHAPVYLSGRLSVCLSVCVFPSTSKVCLCVSESVCLPLHCSE